MAEEVCLPRQFGELTLRRYGSAAATNAAVDSKSSGSNECLSCSRIVILPKPRAGSRRKERGADGVCGEKTWKVRHKTSSFRLKQDLVWIIWSHGGGKFADWSI